MTSHWRILRYLAAVAFAGYFLWFSLHSLDLAMLKAVLTTNVFAAVLLAAALYAAIIPMTGWAWGRLLAGQGETWRVSRLSALLAVTQLAKYVPGNVAQHATRAAMALRNGMAPKPLLITVVQETVLAAAASVIVGVSMLAASGRGAAQVPDSMRAALVWSLPLLVIAVMTLTSIRLAPQDAERSANRMVRLVGRMGGLPGARVALPTFAVYVSNYVLIGIGLWIVGRASGFPQALDLPLVTAAFALSWLIGFLAPGAPAGLGVREGIMVVLLSGSAGNEYLLVFVLLARLVTMLGDAINFLLGTAWFALDAKRSGTP